MTGKELSQDEVREFAENVGWQHVTEAQICGVTCETDLWAKPDGSIPYSLPDFPSDLAACFEGLEWFCATNGDGYEVGMARNAKGMPGEYWCGIFDGEHTLEEPATAKQAAIIRAVNSAAKARSKARERRQE